MVHQIARTTLTNEAGTRTKVIKPWLRASGWGKNRSSIPGECHINAGNTKSGGVGNIALKANYAQTS